MGKKEDAIGALEKWGGLLDKRKEPPSVPPTEVLDNLENQSVAKDMTIQALREDIKAQLSGELEVSWSYVALFAVAAAQLSEQLSTVPHDPAASSWKPQTVLLEGDKLEQVFGEYEFKREPLDGGVRIAVIRRKDQKAILHLRISLPPGAASL